MFHRLREDDQDRNLLSSSDIFFILCRQVSVGEKCSLLCRRYNCKSGENKGNNGRFMMKISSSPASSGPIALFVF